jgi:predicted dehydrogenase
MTGIRSSPSVPTQAGLVRVMVVGAGDISRFVHLPALKQNPNATIVGIAARTRARLAKLAADFAVDNYDTSWQRLLAATNPDLVVVATPNASHFEVAIGCLRHGAHVLLEKPGVLSTDEGQILLEEAAAHGREVRVNLTLRLLPAVQRLQSLITTRLQPSDVAYEIRYYISKPAQDWYKDVVSAGGGLIFTVGTHALDLISYISGQPILGVDSGMVGGSADEARLAITLHDGSRAVALLGWNARGLSLSLTAKSARGEARLHLGPGDASSLHFDAQPILTDSLWDKLVTYSSCNLFVDRILNGSSVEALPDLAEHMQVLAPIFAIQRSENRWHA